MLLTKLPKACIDFINEIASSGRSKSVEVSLSLAYALAMEAPLPTSPVTDLVDFFRDHYAIEISNFLSQLNEIVVIDREQVSQYVMKFYQYRYQTCYPPAAVLMLNADTAVLSFFGITRALDVNILEVIQNNHSAIMNYTNKFITLRRELAQSSRQDTMIS